MKRLLLVFTGFACVLIAGYFVHAWLTRTRINRETFEQIEVGMTLEEVEDLIGVPPGSYETRHRRFDAFGSFDADIIFLDGGSSKSWSSNDGEITIHFSEDGRVVGKNLQEVELESLQDTIWRWFGYPRHQQEYFEVT